MTTRQRYEKHLKKVCKVKPLRQAAMEFYDDFCEYYQGQVFTRDNFETLKINGEVVEQDIVKDLFKDRDEVLPEEVLTYLFTHHIKTMRSFAKRTTSTAGSINPLKQRLRVHMQTLASEVRIERDAILKMGVCIPYTIQTEKERNEFLREENKKKRKEFKERKQEIIEKAKTTIYERMKGHMYHELAHIMEIRSFLNGKYIKIGCTNEISIKGSKIDISCCSDEISADTFTKLDKFEKLLNALLKSKGLQKQISENQDFCKFTTDAIADSGYNEISEYMNEELSLRIGKEFSVSNQSPYYHLDDFCRKSRIPGDCAYNQNYDISQLVKLAIGDMDEKVMRFNSVEFFERINNLRVSDQTLLQSKETLHSVLNKLILAYPEKEKWILECADKNIDNLSSADLIGVAMGLYADIDSKNWNDTLFEESKAQCKLIVQNILIEAIKNNTLQDLADETVVKNELFFEKLNETLTTIDSVILYPKDNIKYYHLGSLGAVGQLHWEYVREIEILSVDEFARMHDDLPHITTFAELCTAARIAKTLYVDDIHGLDEKMTFFQQQIGLDKKRFEKLEIQRDAIEQREQYKKEARIREERRRKQAEEWFKKNGITPDSDWNAETRYGCDV